MWSKETLVKLLNSRLLVYFLVVVTGLFIFNNIKSCIRIKSLEEEIGKGNIKTDTIYIDKYLPGNILTKYKFTHNPFQVTLWKFRPIIHIDTVTLKGDTLTLYRNDTIIQQVKTNFLTLYPLNPKLISFDLDSKEFRLNLLNTDGREYTELYNINLDNNKYRYVDNQMTFKPKLNLKLNFNAEYIVRPMVNMHDLNLNITLKTGKITYIGGVNSYYYPLYDSSIKLTPVVGLRYTP